MEKPCTDLEVLILGCLRILDQDIGWDKYPIARKIIYQEKEGYPAIAYKVIYDDRHKILAKSQQGHRAGARNDKIALKLDDAVAVL
jgi:hypothetical protein